MRPAYLIILIVLNFFWAAALSAYKIIEPDLEPGGIVTLRFGLAAVSLLVLWPWLPGAAPRGRDLAKTCALGLIVFVLGHRLQVLGNKLGTASNSSVLVAVEPLIGTHSAEVIEFAATTRLPAIYDFGEMARRGGLIAYATVYIEHYALAADYVDKILKGAKPGALPVQQPARFELVINLKTAKALGLTIPQSLLLRADEVIQ